LPDARGTRTKPWPTAEALLVREFQRGSRRKTPEKIGIKAPLPEFVPPAPASVPKRVPHARWIHEIKFYSVP
jgi:ATP-dependent DNA ligase